MSSKSICFRHFHAFHPSNDRREELQMLVSYDALRITQQSVVRRGEAEARKCCCLL